MKQYFVLSAKYNSLIIENITYNNKEGKAAIKWWTGRWCLLLMCFLFSVKGIAQSTDKYIAKYTPLATELSIEYGIPSSIILAIAAVESSSGTGWACKHLHNHFGIVGKNQNAKNGKRKSRYKQYKNDIASFRDFCKVISRKKFYDSLKGNPNYRLWVKAISKTGYSEIPAMWQKKILYIIDKYGLKGDTLVSPEEL